jgi:hypothetical protein
MFLHASFFGAMLLFLLYRRRFGTLLILSIVMLFFSSKTVYASSTKFDTGRSHHIRVSASLLNYDIGIKGIRYTLVKYGDSGFEKPISTYDFEPTILKEVNEAFTSDNGPTAYRGISPDIYEATPGYYEIYQVISPGDAYYNPGKIRFKIDTKGVFEAINTDNFNQNYELNTGIMYDPGAESYAYDGSIKKSYEGQRAYFYNFKVSTSNKLTLHKRASSYNSKGLLPIGEDFFDINNTAYYELFVLQEDTREWVKINYPNTSGSNDNDIAGCFPVEIEKYGGGLRDNFGELINYFYKYNFEIGLTPNMSYKFEQKYTPINFRKNKDGDIAPMFTFYIKTGESSEIEYAKMGKDTYEYYAGAYHYIFNQNKGNISRDLIVEEKVYKNSIPGLNIDRRSNISIIFLLNIDSRDVEDTSSFSVSESLDGAISYDIPKNIELPPFEEDNLEDAPLPNIVLDDPKAYEEPTGEDTGTTSDTTGNTWPTENQPEEQPDATGNEEIANPEQNAPNNPMASVPASNETPQEELYVFEEEPSNSKSQLTISNSTQLISGYEGTKEQNSASYIPLLLLFFVLLTGAPYILYTNKYTKRRRRRKRAKINSKLNYTFNRVVRSFKSYF